MQNAVIYARYSSSGQNEQSIDGQIEECKKYCEENDFNVVGVYYDKAISGRSVEHRTQFLQMIDDAASKSFEYVVVWKLDRFARNRYDSAIYKKTLSKYGVKVLSAKQNISDTNEGIFYESILEANDEYYSLNLSTNVKRGQRQSTEKGLFVGGHCPYGYKIRKEPVGPRYESHAEIDEDTAPVVKLIFELYSSGFSLTNITKELKKRGYSYYNGSDFKVSFVHNILRNRKYTGKFYFGENKVYNDNIYPPIISDELYDKAQEMLAYNRRWGTKKKAKIEYLLTGKCYCGECGTHMVGTCAYGGHGGIFYYYNCCAQYKKHTCNKHSEKKGFLEWYVTDLTVQYVLDSERIKFIAKRLIEIYKKSIDSSQISSLNDKINNLNRKIDICFNNILDCTDDMRKIYEQRITDMTFLRDEYNHELNKLKALGRANLNENDIIKQLKQFCNGDPMDFDFQKKIIDACINCVYIYDDKIVIYYNSDLAPHGQYVSFIDNEEIIDDINKEEYHSNDIQALSSGSYSRVECPPFANISEPNNVYYIFVNGWFGILIFRK